MTRPFAPCRKDFFRFVAREHDRRHVCGLSPVYVLLHLVKREKGRLLHYGQWPDPQGTVAFPA